MKIVPLKICRLICLVMVAVSGSLVSGTSGPTGGESRDVPKQGPAGNEQTTGPAKQETTDPLGKLLSAALQARGGLTKLKRLKDDYSVESIVYGDVYRTEVLHRTWTMEPYYFRQDLIRDGVILKCQQYDGKHFVEGYGRRVRFGIEKDLNTLLENVELNKIFSLLSVGTNEYPARLGDRTRHEGRWLQEVLVEAPSGLAYRIHFDEETCLIAKLEYVERTQYAQGEEVHPVITCIDSYRNVDGVLVPDRLRIYSEGELKAEVRLVEHRFNVGLSAGFFSMERLRQDLAENPVGSKKVTTAGRPQQEWKESAYRKIADLLDTHRGCRFREVTSYGDPRMYRERLFESELTLVVDPKYLENDDALAFYAELLPAPAGFYEDCIVLAHPPQSASVSAELLLHETTHALLRRRQEQAPLLTPDDEYLMHYQAGLFSLGRLLESFERITLDGRHAAEPERSDKAASTWRAARRMLQQNLRNTRMTPEALEQFREWCGVDFDLNRIRRHYLALGVDPKWMPMDEETGARIHF